MKEITTKRLCLVLLLFPLISFAGWGREWGNSGSGYTILFMIIFTFVLSAIFVGLILAILTRIILFLLNSFTYISNFKENGRVRLLTILGITIVSTICVWFTGKFSILAFIVGMILGFITGISFRFFLLKFIK